MLSKEELKRIAYLHDRDKVELLHLLEQLEDVRATEAARQNFLPFVKRIWPDFIEGAHHKRIAKIFDDIIEGRTKRVIINMPPRHTKSEFASYLLPAYFLGKFPKKKIIMSSHTAELAVGFGRRVRDLLLDEQYKSIFEGVTLKADSKAAGRWNTNHGGEYFACGVGAALAGRGADLFIIDDPHSEQEAMLAMFKPEIFQRAYEWFTSGPRQRLQPNGSIVIVMTRWGKGDLTGKIINAMNEKEGTDRWEVVEFPAILPSGNPLWPEFWPLKLLQPLKDELPLSKWNAQYQQQPTSDDSALVKREWWKPWESTALPNMEYTIQSWDTAFKKTETSDFCACTEWGVFLHENGDGKRVPNIMLIDSFQRRMEFPELKREVRQRYKDFKPDTLLVEAKAAGAPLVYEMRSMGIPVSEYTPVRGNDKIVRVNAVSDLFQSGHVWFVPNRANELTVEQFAEFPVGEHDDLVDTGTQALLKFRQGGFIKSGLDYDYDEEDEAPIRRTARYY